MADEDQIKWKTEIELTDSDGNPIRVETPKPEVRIENFSGKKIDKSKLY